MKRAYVTAVAAAAAVALTAGMTGPASAGGSTGSGQTTKAGQAGQAGARAAAKGPVAHRVTLITGDRVAVDAKGRVLGVERAEGREHIAIRTLTESESGHSLVVPADAQRLIASGRLDQRLFDITELSRKAVRASHGRGLKVIVGYQGTARAAKADVRAADGTEVRRTLKSLNAEAVTTGDPAGLWAAVTDAQGGSARAASGIAHIWLDGVRKAGLDKSVPQIGADKAWASGYDGKGVRIAVLDTGVDATHPDLKDQVVAARNFTPSPDATDKYGHGTHVASIAAGMGAKSAGAYKGVAPGAELLNGKVLDDNGFGDDSGILAGIEWAAEQGADVVNLSLGGSDAPSLDPLETAVNKLSADKGILFAVSAGNDGESGEQTVGSPGSAEAALTVGAVDGDDKLAEFSSRGPRVGDGGIKPDVTAPGVDITAAAAPGSVIEQEVGQNPEGYLTISGTSMAAPHVAGAAAILKQRHPDWTYAELKGALTASTTGGTNYQPYQQGSGRIAVDRALAQTVVAEPVSVNFGEQQWPHTDDTPVAKEITYRNLGTTDITLDLAVTATDPKGGAAPARFFTLGSRTLTVPAGGRASVNLTTDTRLGGTLDGTYSAYVVATDGGQSVRTAAVVKREAEAYDVTLKFVGRDGRPTPDYWSFLSGITGDARGSYREPHDASGTVKVRLPKGTYLFDTTISENPEDSRAGTDWLVQPRLDVTGDMTVTADARVAKPVSITVPDGSAEPSFVAPRYWYAGEGYNIETGVDVDTFDSLRTAHLGPEVTTGSLNQQWIGVWQKGTDTEYDVMLGGNTRKLATGYRKHLRPSDFATVKVGMGASAPGKRGEIGVAGYFPELGGISPITGPQDLPRTRTVHLSTPDNTKWDIFFLQYGTPDEEGTAPTESYYTFDEPRAFKGGATYETRFNAGVLGPRLATNEGIFRDADTITGELPLHADDANHAGWTRYSSVTTTLYRNGVKLTENSDALDGNGEGFTVPSDAADYRLTTSVRRDPALATTSTRVDASWTFRSAKTTTRAQLPISTARFTPKTDLTGRTPADKTAVVPVIVQGPAAGINLKSLTVHVSYDGGTTWTKTPVKNGNITVKNPAKAKSISFRANITDKQGNRSSVTVYDAYLGK
ncbi:S8 family serine peptidase [Streptomyces sp. ActVer]|uniref:S8 family peptidase n=1 Tax=Streptomyces sp. ActVer TaxID=3014558 RepID=UPI0022B2FB5E|nr:S8 family serine peptidase [Streptomyces sp. ActVer]MCZ4514618.1 S8 family serine peptidase [Streptomyces sp. ActVer]